MLRTVAGWPEHHHGNAHGDRRERAMQQGRDDELRPVAIDPQQVRRARLVGREIRYIGVMADEATGAERGGQIIQDLAIAGDHEHLSRRVGECRAAVEAG